MATTTVDALLGKLETRLARSQNLFRPLCGIYLTGIRSFGTELPTVALSMKHRVAQKMDNLASAPCIPDDGIEARIPASPFYVITLVETRNRINSNPAAPSATPEVLSGSLNLSLAQVYAALAYYHANQTAFDAELARRGEAARQAVAALFAGQEGKSSWAEIVGRWPGRESDEEIEAALERIS